MDMKDYNSAQVRIINRAYSQLEYLCECSEWSCSARLRDALKYERKQRDSVTAAKALIVQGALQDIDATALELSWLSPGIATAAMIGAKLRDSHKDKPTYKSFVGLAELAIEAHNNSIQRRLDAIAPFNVHQAAAGKGGAS